VTTAIAARVLAAKAVLRATEDGGSANAALETILERTEGKVRDESQGNQIVVNLTFSGMTGNQELPVVRVNQVAGEEIGPRILGPAREHELPNAVNPIESSQRHTLPIVSPIASNPNPVRSLHNGSYQTCTELDAVADRFGSHPATGGNDCLEDGVGVERVVAEDPPTQLSQSPSFSLSIPVTEPVVMGPIQRKRGRPAKGPIEASGLGPIQPTTSVKSLGPIPKKQPTTAKRKGPKRHPPLAVQAAQLGLTDLLPPPRVKKKPITTT